MRTQIHVLQLLEPAGFSNASAIASSASADGSLAASADEPAAGGSSAGERTSSGRGRRVRHVKTHRVWANASGWEPIPVKELAAGWLAGTERNLGVYLLACDAAGRALSTAVLHIQHARDLPQAEVRRRRRSAEPARGGSKKPCLVLFTESARHQREAAKQAALYSKPGARSLTHCTRTLYTCDFTITRARTHDSIVLESLVPKHFTSLKLFFSQPPAAIYITLKYHPIRLLTKYSVYEYVTITPFCAALTHFRSKRKDLEKSRQN